MNRSQRRLKQIIHEAAYAAGFSLRYFQDDVEALMSSLDDDDDVAKVAARTLFHLCIEDGRFNHSTFGLKAVLRFLAETIPEEDQPDDDQGVFALAAIMKENCTRAKLLAWVREWYGC